MFSDDDLIEEMASQAKKILLEQIKRMPKVEPYPVDFVKSELLENRIGRKAKSELERVWNKVVARVLEDPRYTAVSYAYKSAAPRKCWSYEGIFFASTGIKQSPQREPNNYAL